MATAIPVNYVPRNGKDYTQTAASTPDVTGMTFVNDGNTLIVVKSPTTALTLTFLGVNSKDSERTVSETFSNPIGNTKIYGTFSRDNWNGSSGSVAITIGAASAGTTMRAYSIKAF